MVKSASKSKKHVTKKNQVNIFRRKNFRTLFFQKITFLKNQLAGHWPASLQIQIHEKLILQTTLCVLKRLDTEKEAKHDALQL